MVGTTSALGGLLSLREWRPVPPGRLITPSRLGRVVSRGGSCTTASCLDRLERFYDAMPRDAARGRSTAHLCCSPGTGPAGRSMPAPASTPPRTVAGRRHAVRARQRELGLPEAFEWVHETTPDLLATARAAGLSVLEAPLMVLDPVPPRPTRRRSPTYRCGCSTRTRPASPLDVAARRAVAAVGFSAAGTARGDAGPAERDAAMTELDVAALDEERARIADGRRISAVAGRRRRRHPGQRDGDAGRRHRRDRRGGHPARRPPPGARRGGHRHAGPAPCATPAPTWSSSPPAARTSPGSTSASASAASAPPA